MIMEWNGAVMKLYSKASPLGLYLHAKVSSDETHPGVQIGELTSNSAKNLYFSPKLQSYSAMQLRMIADFLDNENTKFYLE